MKNSENMDKLYDKILEKLNELRNSSNDEVIQRYSSLLGRIVLLKGKIEQIENLKKDLEDEFRKLALTETEENTPIIKSVNYEGVSTRELGSQKRNEFLSTLKKKGIQLKQRKGVIYENPRDSSPIGIAYSGEKYRSWFLGLPMENYKIIVLLCSNEDNTVNAIILPEEFCLKYLNSLSRSHGQFKFSVRMKNKETFLYTKLGSVSVTQYINNFSPLLK